METLNELVILLIGYHVCVLAGFDLDPKTRNILGVSIICLVIGMTIVNYTRWFAVLLKAIKLKCVRYQTAKDRKRRLKEIKEEEAKKKQVIKTVERVTAFETRETEILTTARVSTQRTNRGLLTSRSNKVNNIFDEDVKLP